MSFSSSFQLSTLPPTTAAAKQHSFRAYLTVQEWMGRSFPPTSWGWKFKDILTLICTDCPIAPDKLLNMISCGCKPGGCSILCSCRNIGVYCSILCMKCNGKTCNNTPPETYIDSDEEIDEPVSTILEIDHENDK